eukprot:6202018-Pleurochrysis_carterae.AAC.1
MRNNAASERCSADTKAATPLLWPLGIDLTLAARLSFFLIPAEAEAKRAPRNRVPRLSKQRATRSRCRARTRGRCGAECKAGRAERAAFTARTAQSAALRESR